MLIIIIVLILIVPTARFLSARNVEANCNVSADKLPHGYDLKKIALEELKGTWRWYSIDGDDVHGADFILSFTGNNIVQNGTSGGSLTDDRDCLWAGFYYLSDSPDSRFDMNKMLSDKGKYIIVKNVFYYNGHYNNDTFVFPTNKVTSDTTVISCPLNDMGKLILKRE